MEIILWILQVILAAMFAMAGANKSTKSIEQLKKMGIYWADRFPVSTVRFIGISELLGAIGLILPWWLNIVPILTPIAAAGLALVMLLAIFHHLKQQEYKAIAINFGLLSLAAVVAYFRFTAL
jgi:uncharacterized membrane protein YphA (DoxX/SURF4 family)